MVMVMTLRLLLAATHADLPYPVKRPWVTPVLRLRPLENERVHLSTDPAAFRAPRRIHVVYLWPFILHTLSLPMGTVYLAVLQDEECVMRLGTPSRR